MLSSKEKLNNYLPTLMKHLCWTHTSACLGINSRQCNDKKAINTSRIVHFLEHFKCRPAAANAYFSDLYQPWRNCCPETMNALGMETLSLRQIRQISRIRPNNVLGLFSPFPDKCQSADNPYLVTGPFIMRMLSILGDNVFQFFRQGKTVNWENKIIAPTSILARYCKRWVEVTICYL